ncbi:hypothetical protein ACV229_10915 [Burkholderia sp. MR1-5-21]
MPPLAALYLLVALVGLAVSKKARALFRRHKAASFTGIVIVTIPAISFLLTTGKAVHDSHREHAYYEALSLTLEQPARVWGLDMPAGTKLVLAESGGGPETFSHASFPYPVWIHGVHVTSMDRNLGRNPDEDAARIALWGDGQASPQEGWVCGYTDETYGSVGFATTAQGQIRNLTYCTLAAGNRVADIPLPGLSRLELAQTDRELSAISTDFAPGDYWHVELVGDKPIIAPGPLRLALLHSTLLVSQERTWLGVGRAELAAETRVGPLNYPPGTRVMTADTATRASHPGAAWAFKLPRGHTLRYAGHATITDEQVVLHSATGKVVAAISPP